MDESAVVVPNGVAEEHDPITPEPTPIVPPQRAPGKLPRAPQAVKNQRKRKTVEEPPPKTMAEMTNEEFVIFPKEEGEFGTVPLIVIRSDNDGGTFYRMWGFEQTAALKAILAAATHLGGQTADQLADVVQRLNAVVGAAVGVKDPPK